MSEDADYSEVSRPFPPMDARADENEVGELKLTNEDIQFLQAMKIAA